MAIDSGGGGCGGVKKQPEMAIDSGGCGGSGVKKQPEMAIDSGESGGGGSGGAVKKQRVDDHDRCEAAGSDAIQADRISALPDDLRLHMLTRLPLKDAIRTGALARGWRDLWKRRWGHRASLEVHLRSRDDTRRELDKLAREPRPRRHLDRFSLTVDTSYLKSSELQRFLDYATECGVEDLHVETRKATAAAKLRFHLPLSSPALACLSLRSIAMSMFYYSHQLSFHALEVIRLVSVSFHHVHAIIASCPSLVTLDLHRCRLNHWALYRLPPKLRSFTISECECDRITGPDFLHVPNLRSFRYSGEFFANLPLSIARNAALFDLYIHLRGLVSTSEWNIEKLRKSLPKDLSSLNVLTISSEALKAASVWSIDGATQLPSFNLHSLKELHLLMFEMKAVNLYNVYMFLKIFQCLNLERLFVQLPAYTLKPTEGSIDQVWEEPAEDGLDNLVIVKVMNFNWCPIEVRLVSFLLRKARSLQKLLIVSRNVTPVDSPGAPEADLSLLKEALVNGKIMFTESDNAATQPYHKACVDL